MKQFSRNTARVLVAGASAVAVAATTGAVLAPAGAQSGDMIYVCTTPLGPQEFTTVSDTDLPAKMKYGATKAPVVNTSQVTVPGNLSSLAYGLLGARSVEGTAVVNATVGDTPVTIDTVVPSTPVPAEGDLPVDARGEGPAFTADKIGPTVVTAGDYTANLSFKKEDGTTAIDVVAACTPKTQNADGTPFTQDLTVDTVEVIKANTSTKTTVKQRRGKRTLAVSSVVKSRFDTPVTGRVKYVVKRNGKVLRQRAVWVSIGKVAFRGLPKNGHYRVSTRYLGSDTLKGSGDVDLVRWIKR